MNREIAGRMVVGQLGAYLHVDCDVDLGDRTRWLVDTALDVAETLAERARFEGVAPEMLVAVVAELRDDRRHPMLERLDSGFGWGEETAFNYLQELLDAVLGFLEEPPSADVTILRYGHGGPQHPVAPGRTLLVVDSRERARLTHFLWPERNMREAKLLPGVWEEIVAALARTGFPEGPPAGVITPEMTKLSLTRIVGARVEGVTAEPREPYLELWRLLLGIVGQMRGSRDFERRVSDVRLR